MFVPTSFRANRLLAYLFPFRARQSEHFDTVQLGLNSVDRIGTSDLAREGERLFKNRKWPHYYWLYWVITQLRLRNDVSPIVLAVATRDGRAASH